MQIAQEELISVLKQFNPWWEGGVLEDLPSLKRAAFRELLETVVNPPANRATLLSGARQIGKTTLIMQVIDKLLEDGVPAGNILYATFDHPLLKSVSIEKVIEAWLQREPQHEGVSYIFLDEAQFICNWGTWIKHQVDFAKNRRIVFTGSATPILSEQGESGLGRWQTIKLTTLSFFEYLRLKQISLPDIPPITSLKDLFALEQRDLLRISSNLKPYIAYFNDYLIRGGFPQTIMVDNINKAQSLLREDIVDKALKRDMTAIFGIRRVMELEQLFLYLCMHDGGILDMNVLSDSLGVKRPTAQNFIELLEAAYLIFRLQPFGYGKEVLRGKSKVYLADCAVAPAVMLKGKAILDNPESLGVVAESSVIKHLFASYYRQNIKFSYWRGKRDLEVDLVAEIAGEIIPFEVKYRGRHTSLSECKGLAEFCLKHELKRGYIVTKMLDDFSVETSSKNDSLRILKIPAMLLCYLMGEMET